MPSTRVARTGSLLTTAASVAMVTSRIADQLQHALRLVGQHRDGQVVWAQPRVIRVPHGQGGRGRL